MGYPEHLLTDDEVILDEFHPHWRVLLPAVGWGALFAAAAAAVWYLGGRTAADETLVTGPLAAAVAAGLTLLVAVPRWVRWYATRYVLTTERIVVRTGIVSRSGVEIPLESINNVLFSQSVLERLLGYGDVLIESAGSQGQSRLTDIPDPEDFQSDVYRAREERTIHLERSGRAPDPVDQLERLAHLRDQGVLSDEEFEGKKRDLLGRI